MVAYLWWTSRVITLCDSDMEKWHLIFVGQVQIAYSPSRGYTKYNLLFRRKTKFRGFPIFTLRNFVDYFPAKLCESVLWTFYEIVVMWISRTSLSFLSIPFFSWLVWLVAFVSDKQIEKKREKMGAGAEGRKERNKHTSTRTRTHAKTPCTCSLWMLDCMDGKCINESKWINEKKRKIDNMNKWTVPNQQQRCEWSWHEWRWRRQ